MLTGTGLFCAIENFATLGTGVKKLFKSYSLLARNSIYSLHASRDLSKSIWQFSS